MTKPIPLFFTGVLVVLTGVSIWTFFVLAGDRASEQQADELVHRLAELQLLLFVAFIALFPKAADIRRAIHKAPTPTSQHPIYNAIVPAIYVVLVLLSIGVAAYAFSDNFDSGPRLLLIGLVSLTAFATVALLIDATREAQRTPEETADLVIQKMPPPPAPPKPPAPTGWTITWTWRRITITRF